MRLSNSFLHLAKDQLIALWSILQKVARDTFWVSLHAESANCKHRRSCFALLQMGKNSFYYQQFLYFSRLRQPYTFQSDVHVIWFATVPLTWIFVDCTFPHVFAFSSQNSYSKIHVHTFFSLSFGSGEYWCILFMCPELTQLWWPVSYPWPRYTFDSYWSAENTGRIRQQFASSTHNSLKWFQHVIFKM
jgi:hypothetical protein